jgi:thiol-disulfide isomerase/thioredoxin
MKSLLRVLGLCLSLLVSCSSLAESAFNFYGVSVADGQLFSMRALKERPKVVNFFWVECQPCKQELPELAQLQQTYPSVVFLALHKGSESLSAIKTFIDSLPSAPEKVIKVDDVVAEKYRANYLPYTLLINQRGEVVHRLTGYTPENMHRLEQWLKQYEPVS